MMGRKPEHSILLGDSENPLLLYGERRGRKDGRNDGTFLSSTSLLSRGFKDGIARFFMEGSVSMMQGRLEGRQEGARETGRSLTLTGVSQVNAMFLFDGCL